MIIGQIAYRTFSFIIQEQTILSFVTLSNACVGVVLNLDDESCIADGAFFNSIGHSTKVTILGFAFDIWVALTISHLYSFSTHHTLVLIVQFNTVLDVNFNTLAFFQIKAMLAKSTHAVAFILETMFHFHA